MRNLFLHAIALLAVALLVSCSSGKDETATGTWQMRGVVLSVEDLQTVDWPKLAHENGINTIGTHIHPGQVKSFIESENGQRFLEECKEYGIDVEHQLHAMTDLLPRELFAEDPTMFRMDTTGARVADFNCCVHSEKALEIIARNAAEYAKALPSTNHRYYFWLDDNVPVCSCPECSGYSPSEQALIVENRMIKALREVDPEAMLAHLCYIGTLPAPVKVRPEEGIFLEFAPMYRTRTKPLKNLMAMGDGAIPLENSYIVKCLYDNLKVFPAETAVVLEYWLDVSMYSHWQKPAVELPWNREMVESDLVTYGELGIRNVTSFAVYMDSTYFASYPDVTCLKEYGRLLEDFTLPEVPVLDIPYGGKPSRPQVVSLTDPWKKVTDHTRIFAWHDSDSLYLSYSVKDRTLWWEENPSEELAIGKSDRIEFFISKDRYMTEYLAAEIDPSGNVMDYWATFYRNLDYTWNIPGLGVRTTSGKNAYTVDVSIPLEALESIGMLSDEKEIHFGLCRADVVDMPMDGWPTFHWLSWIDPGTPSADFHLPTVLGRFKLE